MMNLYRVEDKTSDAFAWRTRTCFCKNSKARARRNDCSCAMIKPRDYDNPVHLCIKRALCDCRINILLCIGMDF